MYIPHTNQQLASNSHPFHSIAFLFFLCEYELAQQFLVVLIKCGTSEIKNKYRFSPTANGLSVQ